HHADSAGYRGICLRGSGRDRRRESGNGKVAAGARAGLFEGSAHDAQCRQEPGGLHRVRDAPWRGGAMNRCSATQARFSEYLDGRLNGREMHEVAAHLEGCPRCAREWESLRKAQAALSSLGPVPEPEDLLLRIRVAVSQEQARSRKTVLNSWNLVWRNTVGPFLLQASAGFASAVLLLGAVIVLVTMFTQPEVAQANTDVPLGNPTAPR